MQTARRLYVYLLTGIGLGVLVGGVTLLLTTLFDALGLGSGTLRSDDQALRERLTLATAMTVVALPVWLIHWFAAERSVRPGGPGADMERSSDVRGLYFFLALGVLLLAGVGAARSLIEAGGLALAGQSQDFRSPAGDLALFMTAGAAWLYHVRVRTRDWSAGTIVGAGAWLPRAYLYLAAYAGLFVMLFGISDLLGLAGQAVAGQPEGGFGRGEPGAWWAYPLTSSISAVISGGLTWMGHWWYSARLLVATGPRGASERSSRVRLAFFVGVLVLAAGAAIGYLSDAMGTLLETMTGVTELAGTEAIAAAIVSVMAATLFALTWWLHAGWLRQETIGPDASLDVDGARRLESYPLALVGLGFGAAGVAGLVGLLLDVLLGGGRTLVGGDVWQRELASFLPFAIFGSALWLWQWSKAMRTRELAPAEEAASTVRRASLLIILAVSILSGIVALGLILYRVFGTLFGLDVPGDTVAELSTPIGVLLIAVSVAAYHGAALRRDQALQGPHDTPVPVPVPVAARASVSLRLIAPTDATPAELTAVTEALRQTLAPGYRLEDDRVE